MSIPREFIDLLLSKIDLVDLINTQVPLRKKSSSNYFARCPFHSEKSASFSVSQPKQFYYCFGCGAHGNAIDFVMKHNHLDFKEAIELLARQTGMEVPHASSSTYKKESSHTGLYDFMVSAASYYYEQMRKSERAVSYLKNRGISGVIAQQFNIGFSPPGWSHVFDHFSKNPENIKKLFDTGLIIKKEEGGYYDRFRDRIMFPIEDHRGRIIGFGGRIIDKGEPKYLNSPETSLFQKGHELYGLYQALKANRTLSRVLIVEGYMDVIALFQHGIPYAVATLGTATTAHHLTRLFRYTEEIIFCFDGDEAGKKAAWRALLVVLPLMQDHLQIRFLFLPNGEDPDSLIRKEGKEQFEKRIDGSALSLSAFFFKSLSQQCDMETMEGRARFTSLALGHLKDLPSGIFQSLLLDELAKKARISIEELKKRIDNPQNTVTPQQKPSGKNKIPLPIYKALALLVQYPNLVNSVEISLNGEGPAFDFLSNLISIIKKNPNITTGSLIEYWRGLKEKAFIAKLANWNHMIPENGIENEFRGTLRQINQLGLSSEINKLLAKAAEGHLTEHEKLELSFRISQKKQPVDGNSNSH